ncbi:hypothetical protein FHG89_13090 [Micromonospora orduensis]|uniref:Tat pathway signal sequence domain protein n=1 Tax=Micromonospora orduensis TaxID=1420891 RepID=A0A5C4QTS0_9ACTN|nr:hypothetical protein [Micromonospora orduensis]TNH29276.1 hypothetical protein FHG89_13090 [Micromonospora orduensis]
MTARSIRRPLVATGLVAAAATLAFTPSASASVPLRAAAQADGGALTAITLGTTGKLDANGAAVFVPVTLTCSKATEFDVTIKVAQAVGETMRAGTTVRRVTCAATTQEVRIAVIPVERPFARGVAFGVVSASSCDPGPACTTLTDEHRFDLAR